MDISNLLQKRHREAGITLERFADYMELRAPGKKPLTFGIQALLELVWHEADQIVQWSRSGVVFGKGE